jgi:hypothetical protein
VIDLEEAPVPSPKLIPFESPKTIEPRLLEVVPAEIFTGEGAAVPAAAVTFVPSYPKVTPPALPKAPEISLPTAFRVNR